jgi:predicted MFS family arabinose efflux permease
MTPVGRTIILRAAPRSELVSAMNWFTMPAQLGPLLGPPVAGLVLQVADWRWIFLINLPIAVLGAVAVWRFVPDERATDQGGFDLRGYLLAAGAIILFTGAVEAASLHGWAGWPLLAVLGAVLCGRLYFSHARREVRPVLDLRLFADRSFRISMVGGTLARFAVGALPLLMPLLLQLGMGWTPLQAGLVMMGQAIGTVLAKASSTSLIRRYSFRTVLIGSNLAAAALTMMPALFTEATPMWVAFGLLLSIGLTRSTQFTINNTVAYADLPGGQLASASTMASVVQQLGHALGISLAGLLLAGELTGAGLPGLDRYTTPLLLIGLLAGTASMVYMRLPASAGEAMRGRSSAGN